MKIHPDIINAPSISSYGKGWVQVADERLTRSVVMASDGRRFEWPCARFEDLTAEHFEQLAQLRTELVIFGTGERLRFPSAALTRSLIECQIGLESMDTQAACRTYNILAGEGRHVAVALLMEPING
jgi:uncharacterized protein